VIRGINSDYFRQHLRLVGRYGGGLTVPVDCEGVRVCGIYIYIYTYNDNNNIIY